VPFLAQLSGAAPSDDDAGVLAAGDRQDQGVGGLHHPVPTGDRGGVAVDPPSVARHRRNLRFVSGLVVVNGFSVHDVFVGAVLAPPWPPESGGEEGVSRPLEGRTFAMPESSQAPLAPRLW